MTAGRVCCSTAWLALSALFSGPVLADEVRQIVALPFAVSGDLDAKQGRLLDDFFLAELTRFAPKGVKIMGSSDVEAMLGQIEKKQLMGCDDTSCFVEIGQALGASHIVTATLGTMGSKYLVNIKLLDVDKATVLFRESAVREGNAEAAVLAVGEMARRLAASRGWTVEPTAGASPAVVRGAEAAALVTEAAQAEPVDERRGSPLLVPGVAAAAAGSLAAVGCGVGVVVLNARAGDTSLPRVDQRNAGLAGLGMIGGTALGGVVLAAGGAMVAVALLSGAGDDRPTPGD